MTTLREFNRRRGRDSETTAQEELVFMLRAGALTDESFAIIQGHIDSLDARQLIAPGNGHDSLVHFAIFHYHPRAALAMLRKMVDADLLATDEMLGDYSPVSSALDKGGRQEFVVSIIEQLSEEDLLKFAVENGDAPWLWLAAAMNDRDIVSALIKRLPVDVCAKGGRGMSPLYIVARNGHVEMAQLLLQAIPALATVKTKSGELPMDVASSDEMKSLLSRVKRADAQPPPATDSVSNPASDAADGADGPRRSARLKGKAPR